MPELPEVETLCRDLKVAGVSGSRIKMVEVFWERSIREPSVAEFCRRLTGTLIEDIGRRGKYLLMFLEDGAVLLTHLRMTGGFSFGPAESGRNDRHDRVVFHLDTGKLIFHDTRKFGRMILTMTPEAVLDRLGPEPLEVTLETGDFCDRLRQRRRALKPLLLDQQFLAGLGNIYTDESLFAARLHPLRGSDDLSLEEATRLLQAIRHSLETGIINRGTSLGDGETNFSSNGRYGSNAPSLKVFRKTGSPCPRCGTPIERIVVSQRSTHFCPRCQKAPAPAI